MSRKISGLGAWAWQRISALYIGAFLIYIVIGLLRIQQLDYSSWLQWSVDPLNSILMFIGFVLLFLHAWIGIRDVVMDYIHHVAMRAVSLMLIGLALMMCLVWVTRILLLAILQ